MSLKIIESKNMETDFINDVLELDSIAYSENMQGSYESVNNRYKKNEDSYLLVYDEKTLIGYICFFPISKKLYNEMLVDNKMKDDDISPKDIIPYTEGKSHNLFIISVVIHPDYRNGEAIKLLTSTFVDFIHNKIKTNYHINSILATAVSDDGVKFLERLNFEAIKTYDGGYKLFESKKVRLNLDDGYKKTYNSDMYIMVPYSSKNNPQINQELENDDLSLEYINCMEDNAQYECNNNVVHDLKRVFIRKSYLACMDDDYTGKVLAKEQIYMFLTLHKPTGLYLLTIMNLSNNFSPTQIEDQVSTNHLFIYDDNENMISIDEFMKNTYGLDRCGDAKVLISISNKPKDDLEFQYLIAGESYNSRRIDYKLKAQEFIEACNNNFAQYDFYDIYASRNTVVYVLHTFDENLITNIQDEVPILFIMELIMFQNASVLRTNNRITEQLSKNGSVNIKFIEGLYSEFGKTIKFWNKDVYKYQAVQNLSTSIHKAFGTQKILDDYYRNQQFLEHIVNLRDVQNSNRESKILNLIVLVLTAMQVLPVIISFFQWLINREITLSEFIGAGSTIGISSLLLLVIVIILKRKNDKNKHNKAK